MQEVPLENRVPLVDGGEVGLVVNLNENQADVHAIMAHTLPNYVIIQSSLNTCTGNPSVPNALRYTGDYSFELDTRFELLPANIIIIIDISSQNLFKITGNKSSANTQPLLSIQRSNRSHLIEEGRRAWCFRDSLLDVELRKTGQNDKKPQAEELGGRVYAMRHGRKVPKLNRPPDQRKALLRALTTQLLKHGRIKTTRARASAMRKFVDKMITLAKDGSLHKRRQALGYIYEKLIVHALFAEVPERYGERNGGYTRIIRTLPRRGDNAPMAYSELV
ncbi:uncharacterized protein LOC113359817 [Papaver somniferum]|uniref:uncharacterized protein LOC113359817 n=1 Tax=Papaver somniferum TaxID=3469 RepID=UPI000E6F7D08|nr:uncharacterized protein LOC113359817 [Papaver somniferum]